MLHPDVAVINGWYLIGYHPVKYFLGGALVLGEAQKIGEKIRESRTEKKLSQAELALRAGISLPFLKRVELGQATISAPLLARIARTLEVSTDDLLGHIESDEELVERLWKEENMSKRIAAAGKLDFKAKKAILESLGLWERK